MNLYSRYWLFVAVGVVASRYALDSSQGSRFYYVIGIESIQVSHELRFSFFAVNINDNNICDAVMYCREVTFVIS